MTLSWSAPLPVSCSCPSKRTLESPVLAVAGVWPLRQLTIGSVASWMPTIRVVVATKPASLVADTVSVALVTQWPEWGMVKAWLGRTVCAGFAINPPP